jgi:hypothetical protein
MLFFQRLYWRLYGMVLRHMMAQQPPKRDPHRARREWN